MILHCSSIIYNLLLTPIIFCEAIEDSVMNLRSLLRWFEISASLHINYLKSETFDINLDNNELATFYELLGCVSSSLLSTYLGVPLCTASPRYSLRESIIHKFNKRLASWHGKYLSLGGRITLLKFILSALPVYFLFAFKCPNKVVSSLERIMKILFGVTRRKEKITPCELGASLSPY